jgi:hypothetical protein
VVEYNINVDSQLGLFAAQTSYGTTFENNRLILIIVNDRILLGLKPFHHMINSQNGLLNPNVAFLGSTADHPLTLS